MPAKLDLMGQRFGRLVALREAGRDLHGATMWNCCCDCGVESIVRGATLKAGHTSACRSCAARISSTTHGTILTRLRRGWPVIRAPEIANV